MHLSLSVPRAAIGILWYLGAASPVSSIEQKNQILFEDPPHHPPQQPLIVEGIPVDLQTAAADMKSSLLVGRKESYPLNSSTSKFVEEKELLDDPQPLSRVQSKGLDPGEKTALYPPLSRDRIPPINTSQSITTQNSSTSPRFLSRSIGDAYFRLAGMAIEGSDYDDSFGKSISMNEEGDMIAVSGNIANENEEFFIAYVQVYRFNDFTRTWNQIGSNINSETINYHALFAEIYLSGNGNRLAFATMHREDDGNSVGSVKVYENNNEKWVAIGNPVEGGSSGDFPGLKVCMSFTGDRLVVGSRYYSDMTSEEQRIHIGRTRFFTYRLGDWTKLGDDLLGDSQYDYAGSSVAMTSDGLTVAIGATGDDSILENTGRVKVFRFNQEIEKWEMRGNEIIGEAEDDESGFAVDIANNGSRVATGAIYNDGNNGVLRHSGHVRVYDFFPDDNTWRQVGADIDGDHGFVADGDNFHVGDALGFSISMSAQGNKLAIGAPLYSKNRQAGYYGGVTKLYELVSNQWEQVAYDLNTTDTDASTGYSVALSSNGKRFAIGSPGPVTGLVQVYDQYEVSNFPSVLPSTIPSNIPTSYPTSQPSSTPSIFPSALPTKLPSLIPSEHPSFAPSAIPSDKPSMDPSSGPTSDLSAPPSAHPSVYPSVTPSSKPSKHPSSQPTSDPSSNPSSIPTNKLSETPSTKPTANPSPQPSSKPSDSPSSYPTSEPSTRPTNLPSSSPSLEPSSKPSDEPSSFPSAKPSIYPSVKPSSGPSSVPSIEPSKQPTEIPSGKPSALPSPLPSLSPSSAPTSLPSFGPSLLPSTVPSKYPTEIPSVLPSNMPSSTPSTIHYTPFLIRSSYDLFEKFTDEITWCIQASGLGANAALYVRPCNYGDNYQIWYLDSDRKLHLQNFKEFCVVYEGRKLGVLSCDEAQPINFDRINNSISFTKRNSKIFYIIVDSFKAFSRLKLNKEGSKNSSWNTWHMDFGVSPAPSMIASIAPTTLSSTTPSEIPTIKTYQPSYIPSLNNDTLMPSNQSSMQPSLYPSIGPTAPSTQLPSHRPSSIPTALPSASPTFELSTRPTMSPTIRPSGNPSGIPTFVPTGEPTDEPSRVPSSKPSVSPMTQPSMSPSMTPTWTPSAEPSRDPSLYPTGQPSLNPSMTPTRKPSSNPSKQPSTNPSVMPSVLPTVQPSLVPTEEPSFLPSRKPTFILSSAPTNSLWRQMYDQVLIGDNREDYFGQSVAMAENGLRVAVGATGHDAKGLYTGQVKVFQDSGTKWVQVGKDIIGEAENNYFGNKISLSHDGMILASGSTLNRDDNGLQKGSVRVFQDINSNWIQMHDDIDGENVGDRFGLSVSLSSSGSILAIGAAYNDGNGQDAGHIRTFRQVDSQWIQFYGDLDGDTPGDLFGSNLSMSYDGKKMAVSIHRGPYNNGGKERSVRVYQDNDSQWVHMYNQNIESEDATDWFGFKISLSSDGKRLAIGTPYNDNGSNSGYVRIFQDTNSQWEQHGQDLTGEDDENFGKSVALSADGKRLAICEAMTYEASRRGRVTIYEDSGAIWVHMYDQNIDGEGSFDQFGFSLAISGDGTRLVAGSPINDNRHGKDAGHVKIYQGPRA